MYIAEIINYSFRSHTDDEKEIDCLSKSRYDLLLYSINAMKKRWLEYKKRNFKEIFFPLNISSNQHYPNTLNISAHVMFSLFQLGSDQENCAWRNKWYIYVISEMWKDLHFALPCMMGLSSYNYADT